jgi:hypothetical protein
MRTRTKLLITTMIVGVLGSLAALGIFGSFSATTQNSGNEVTSGTVAISNNSAGQALFSVNGAVPGQTWVRCIKVTYTGSLPSDVHLYLGGTPGPLAQYLNVTIEEGTQTTSTFPSCTGFVSNDTLFTGALTGGNSNYDNGLVTYPGGVSGAWTNGSSTVYRITVNLDPSAPNSEQAQSTGVLTAFWEAHNE